MPVSNKATAHRTFKPIWFLPTYKAKRKNQKSLNFNQRTRKKINMDYLTYSERLNYLLEMIEKGQLLSLKQASEKFGCSESTIKRMLKTIREQGHHIKYCKIAKKYFIEI